MNYMKQVAEMLGVELGEEFNVDADGDTKYKFTEKYLVSIEPDGFCEMAMYTLSGLLNGEFKLIKIPKSVLDKKEKEYLSYVIKPFRDSITYFYKRRYENDELEWIKIEMKNDDVMYFPKFKKGTMYKKMELNKKYTLEDLDL